jgi:tetratricopeptide (TPR) repeat protein
VKSPRDVITITRDKGATMKLFNVVLPLLLVVLCFGCKKPQQKSAGELYDEAQIYLTDIDKGDPAKALELLNKAISLDPGYLDAFLSRADAYMSLGEQEKAFADFDNALQINRDNPDIYLKRGQAYSDLQQYEKAFADFNHALALNPNYANVYFERGRIYFTTGDYKKAYDDFAKTLTIDPNHTKAALYLDEVRPLMK